MGGTVIDHRAAFLVEAGGIAPVWFIAKHVNWMVCRETLLG